MCAVIDDPAGAAASAPREALGSAVDPIRLDPVDEVVVTTLVDNFDDALLTGDERISRAPFGVGRVSAPQFESGRTAVGLRAEHGFAALVTVRRGASTLTLLFDTGLSPDALVVNADRLGLRLDEVQAVVLSHGHFDHTGGLAGLAGREGVRSLPMVVHPQVWTRRRLAVPGRDPEELPTLSKRALSGEGFEPIIGPTVQALTTMAPDLVVPGHCSGWRAQHALASALPEAWVTSSVGSSYRLTAA